MGYEVIKQGGLQPEITPKLLDFGCKVNKDCGCNEKDYGCGSTINGNCGSGNKDFKCSRNGGCKACMTTKASRFSQF